MCAQWYSELEFLVWDGLGREPFLFGNVLLTTELLAKFGGLSKVAGGWFEYSDAAEGQIGDGLVFVDLASWERKFSAWLDRDPSRGS